MKGRDKGSQVPELIIVGLGYAGEDLDYGKLRRWELSPVPFGPDPESAEPIKTAALRAHARSCRDPEHVDACSRGLDGRRDGFYLAYAVANPPGCTCAV